MKIARHIFIIAFFSAELLAAQNNPFTKNYEVWNEFAMHNFQQTSDGGYIISTDAMFEMDPITNLGKGFLIKMNNAGVTQWIKEYIKTGPSIKPGDGCSIFQCSDAGYIVSGSLYDTLGNARIRLFRVDAGGNLLWSKLYPGLGISMAYCVRQTSDGGYIVAGSTSDPQFTFTYPYILKTTSSGIPQFGKVIKDPNGYSGEAYSVKQASNGGYIYCGGFANLPLAGKLDAAGNSIWNKKFDSSGMGDFFDIIENTSGSYTAVGDISTVNSGDNYLSIVNFNSSGNINWKKCYGSSPYAIGYSIKETTGGNMIISDACYSTGLGMMLVNSNGNIIWSRIYLSSQGVLPSTVEFTSDASYAFAATVYNGNFGNISVSVIKTNSSGHASCHDSDIVLTPYSINFNFISDCSFIDTIPMQINNLSLVNRVLNENDSCLQHFDSIPPIPPVPCETFFFIPNVFSPNGDHMNDEFRDSVVTCDPQYHMLIYDRWGSLVFESKVNTDHWNGKTSSQGDASEGTYYYVLATNEKSYKGFLTLLR